jgi:hypothetical protein
MLPTGIHLIRDRWINFGACSKSFTVGLHPMSWSRPMVQPASRDKTKEPKSERNNMFLSIGGVLGVLWVLGMVYGYRMGGAIYILLAAAILMTCLGLRQWWQRPVA